MSEPQKMLIFIKGGSGPPGLSLPPEVKAVIDPWAEWLWVRDSSDKANQWGDGESIAVPYAPPDTYGEAIMRAMGPMLRHNI